MPASAETMPTAGTASCRICGGADIVLVKTSDLNGEFGSEQVRITDDAYGTTAAVYRCANCGFMQCLDIADTASAYEQLVDPDYEAGRQERLLQADAILRKLLARHGRGAKGQRLLDVGAGSGILVEVASRLGFDAEGVEPSQWLQQAAVGHGCKVHLGVLPHPSVTGLFDVITIIDVIEHVRDPVALLETAAALLAPEGRLVVITPDVSSIAAKLMGFRWWHFRPAHVGYFNRSTLDRCCSKAGLVVNDVSRPGWYFSVAYLRTRLRKYLPEVLLPREAAWMGRTVVPLNLFDSLMVVARSNEAARAQSLLGERVDDRSA